MIGLGGFLALVLVGTAASRFVSHAKEPSTVEVAKGGEVSSTTPSAPDVQVYIAPDAETLVKAAGLTEGAIKNAVQQGLAKRRIVSIPDNAVINGLEDWASVRFSDVPSEGGSKLNIEFSVRNGASANNQLIRWQATNTIESLGVQTDIPTTLAKQMDNLQAAFSSPSYKKGQSASALPNETPTKSAPEDKAQSERESCEAAAKETGAGAWNCTAREFEREDARLNKEYKRVIAQYKAQGHEDKVVALRKVQIAWLKNMSSECDPMGLPQAVFGCKLDWTRRRSDELANLQ